MPAGNAFFERFLGLSEDRVVDLLKNVHQNRQRAPVAPGATPVLATLLQALQQVVSAPGPSPAVSEPAHLPEQPDWNALPAPDWDSTPLSPATVPGRESDSYERARAHFADVEKRLRDEAKVSDAIIDGLRERAPEAPLGAPPAQQSLRLLALAGGMAGGRFVVANEGREPNHLSFRHTGLRQAPSGRELELAPVVGFEPASLSLTPGTSAVVRVWIDLSELPAAAGRFEMCVDVMANDAPEMKLFVDIDVHAPPEPGILGEGTDG